MANFKLNQTGEQIQADLNLLDSNSATEGQVLTANGSGGASWQNASGGSGALWYIHRVEMRNTEGTSEILFLVDNNAMEITNLDELYLSISGIEVVRYYKQIQGGDSILCSAFYVCSFPTNTTSMNELNLFAFNSQGEIISIPVSFISDTVTPLQ